MKSSIPIGFDKTAHSIFKEEKGMVEGSKEGSVLDIRKKLKKIRRLKEKLAEENNTCSICLEEIEAQHICRIEKCFHCFHFHCLLQWFSVSVTCPNCKSLAERVIYNISKDDDFEFYQHKVEMNDDSCEQKR